MDDDGLLEMARSRGWIDAEGIARIQRERSDLADRGIQRSQWLLAQDLGLISEERARDVRRSTSATHVRALTVEGWRLSGRLGAGGMGDVFRAQNDQGEQAAVKLLLARYARDSEHLRRFAREARASLRLRHPHIVASLSAGAIDNTRYLVMELVPGVTLKAQVLRRPIDTRSAVILLTQMASALRHAWDHGVLHRDVKPSNIMLAPARAGVDEPFCAKLCDFGLARVRRTSEDDAVDQDDTPGELTASGMALGTPLYMSPEQAVGDHNADARSDMYSLGTTIFFALTGTTLFSGASSAAIMAMHVQREPELSALERIGAPAELIALLRRMLAKRREDRPNDWSEVISAAAQIDLSVVTMQSAAEQGYVAPPLSPKVNAAPSDVFPVVAPRPGVAPAIHAGIQELQHEQRQRRSWAWSGALLASAASVVSIVLIAAWHWATPEVWSATPETLPRLLTQVHPGQTIRLAPGEYAPVRLGLAQAGLRLVAESAQHPPTIRGRYPLITDPGAEVDIEGIAIEADAGTAMVVGSGATVALRRCTLRSGGSGIEVLGVLQAIALNATAQDTVIYAAAGASVSCSGTLTGMVGIQADYAHLDLQQVAITATRATLIARGGSLRRHMVSEVSLAPASASASAPVP